MSDNDSTQPLDLSPSANKVPHNSFESEFPACDSLSKSRRTSHFNSSDNEEGDSLVLLRGNFNSGQISKALRVSSVISQKRKLWEFNSQITLLEKEDLKLTDGLPVAERSQGKITIALMYGTKVAVKSFKFYDDNENDDYSMVVRKILMLEKSDTRM